MSIRDNYGWKQGVRVRSKVGKGRAGAVRALSSQSSNGMGKEC